MAALPVVGASNNTWGTELNAYLQVSHSVDGTHNSNYTAAGTNTYTVTITGYTAYRAGDIIPLTFTNASTGASTLNITSLGAKKIYIEVKGVMTQVANKDIFSNMKATLIYDSSLDAAVGGFVIFNKRDWFELVTNANVSANQLLDINYGDPALRLYLADETGGQRVYIWDPTVALPVTPHTGIKPTFAVYGDIMAGDIIAIESNPMTYFMRQKTGLAASATTQLFSAKAINNDTDGGAGIVLSPNDGSGTAAGSIRLIGYGTGAGGFANTVYITTRSGVGALTDRMMVTEGVRVGTPTGGDKGQGTINISGDIYKNNTAYTNPDYVFEKWVTGKIEKFKNNKRANTYKGIMPIGKLEKHIKKNLRLPRVDSKPKGAFERADIVLEKIEELFLYIIELKKEIDNLKKQ